MPLFCILSMRFEYLDWVNEHNIGLHRINVKNFLDYFLEQEPTSIGGRFKRWRMSQGYNQKVLAEKLKVSSSYLGKVEKGEKELSGKLIRGIITIFGIDILSYIMGIGEQKTTKSTKALCYILPKNLDLVLEEYPGLRELYNDKDLLARLRITMDEFEMLAGVKMEADFPLSKEFYLDALLHHRLHLANLVKTNRSK